MVLRVIVVLPAPENRERCLRLSEFSASFQCAESVSWRESEHIFAEWIGAVIGTGQTGVIVHNTLNFGETIRPEWHTNNLDLRVRMACESCNTGWMSDFETEVRPIITPMIRGNARVPLTLRGQKAVATWAVKTAMVAEFLQKLPTRYFTQSERRSLMEEVVPSRKLGAFVWLGRYASRDNGLHGLTTTMIQADGVSRAHLSMFAPGQFAIQVLVDVVRSGKGSGSLLGPALGINC